MHARLFLGLNALLYFVFALWCTIDPQGTSAAVGFSLIGAQGFSEYVAVYGGLEFGVALFFLVACLQSRFTSAGVIFGACFYVSLAVFRSIAIAQVGFNIGGAVYFYCAEVFFALWSLLLLKSVRQ